MTDETNPAYLFHQTHTELLLKLASGELDGRQLALHELANRGLSPVTGRWVGFADAQRQSTIG